MTPADSPFRNRLGNETSPYLLQHAGNPVDWHPWGEEALSLAETLDRPIFLSIGYSACHWCHVMERESFENETIAALMNERFVNIKVDREERPELDAIYMNYVQMTTGSGGWPLTVFLTPAGVPFFGGTYFPPGDHYGRPGFPRVLESAAAAFRERREDLERMAPEIVARLRRSSELETPREDLSPALLEEAASQIARSFDSGHGGFGSAPKFPQAMALGFLIRHHSRTGSQQSLEMVESTLQKMARGGLYDQLGGGFHRYSVDDRWLVPHFEKMLYDNALLAQVYLEAFQVTRSSFFRRIVTGTLDFVLREMTHPEGGFYSALDADSEGEEGRFYVWSKEEVEQELGPETEVFCDYYDVSEGGNFEGVNILHPRADLGKLAQRHDTSESSLEEVLSRSRRRLLEKRETRVRPGLDSKILTAWNGLMLKALSSAGFVLGSSRYLEAAARNAEFLVRESIVENRLQRTWRDGRARLNGYLEDYAATVEGFLALFEASADRRWLALAEELMDQTIKLFWDDASSSFFFTTHDHEELIVRHKEYLDNATPSGNSTCCLNLQRLGYLLDRPRYLELATRQLEHMGFGFAKHPLAFSNWLQALDFHFGPVTEIVVLGGAGLEDPLVELLRDRFLPSRVIVRVSEETPSQELEQAVPLLRGKRRQGNTTTVYVCQDSVCTPPVTDAPDLARHLESLTPLLGAGPVQS